MRGKLKKVSLIFAGKAVERVRNFCQKMINKESSGAFQENLILSEHSKIFYVESE